MECTEGHEKEIGPLNTPTDAKTMNITLTIKPETIEGAAVWNWRFMSGRKFVAGGYCPALADAMTDAKTWADSNLR